MLTIYDSTRPVKPPRRIFGLGISRPGRRDRPPGGPSDDDRAWAATHLNLDARDYDVVPPDLDRLAGEAEAVGRMSDGLPPF